MSVVFLSSSSTLLSLLAKSSSYIFLLKIHFISEPPQPSHKVLVQHSGNFNSEDLPRTALPIGQLSFVVTIMFCVPLSLVSIMTKSICWISVQYFLESVTYLVNGSSYSNIHAYLAFLLWSFQHKAIEHFHGKYPIDYTRRKECLKNQCFLLFIH